MLVHLTGRSRSAAPGTPDGRLTSILEEGHVRPCQTFSRQSSWYVSFTEVTMESLNHVFSRNIYAPWGIVFQKELVYERGGAPVLHVRDDEWAGTASWADTTKARAVRFELCCADWLWEREWRVPGAEGFRFVPSEIVTVIVPSEVRATGPVDAGNRAGSAVSRWFTELNAADKVAEWTRPRESCDDQRAS